jgi:hypothetical protein
MHRSLWNNLSREYGYKELIMAEEKQNKNKYFREFIPEEAVEHAKAARAEMRKSFEAILPPEFIAHRRTARKELLLAAREIINHTIERIDTHEEK